MPVGLLGRDVAARLADDHRELAFPVQGVGHPREDHGLLAAHLRPPHAQEDRWQFRQLALHACGDDLLVVVQVVAHRADDLLCARDYRQKVQTCQGQVGRQALDQGIAALVIRAADEIRQRGVAKTAPDEEPPLTERAYRALRQAIVRGEFEPDARLRVEALSQRFAVSSSPLREALHRLSEQGLVRAVENRGFRVAPLTVAGVRDLARVRILVECEALRDAIANGTDRWEAQAVAAAHALALVERRLGDEPRTLDDEWSARHREFHLSLYAACRSPLLLDLTDVLFDNAERYRRWSARWRQAPRRKQDEHQQLLKAVLARDADRALDLLRRHIGHTEQRVAAALTGLASADAGFSTPA